MSLKKNLIANYFGQIWIGVIGLAFVPQYIKYLGMEAYGLIGFFVLLQSWLTLLDFGMSPTLNREVARFRAGVHTPKFICDLIRTFEIICSTVAGIVFVGFLFIAGWFASDWLNVNTLTDEDVSHALSIMGAVASLRFVEGLYRGAILGFQQHVLLNLVTSLLATLRAIGALLVLILVDSSIQSFFWWQLIISGITVVALRYCLHRLLPKIRSRPVFSISVISHSWKFAGGVFCTTLLALMITQIDKVLLSRLLSLEAFGVYAFSATIAGVIFQFIGPIAQSYYPKLTHLFASEDKMALRRTYHQAAQLMSIAVVPVGFILVAFGEPLIYAWTGNQVLSNQAAGIVAVLAVGTILNGWMHIPYMLQLGAGWAMFSVWVNVVAVIILAPAIYWVTPRYGPIGAAYVWGAVNAGYVLVSIHFMHIKLLPSEKWIWYVHDLSLPTLFTGIVVAASYMMHPSLTRMGDFLWISVTGVLALLAAIISASEIRESFYKSLKNLFCKYEK